MISGHTHVIRTTAAKLEAELDSWLNPPDPAGAESTDYTCHHLGGRDWVIVLRHSDHPAGAHKPSGNLVHVEHYEDSSEFAGLVEDENASWILYFDAKGRPVSMWLRRDTDGGVVGEPITFSGAQVDTVPGWDLNELRAYVGKGGTDIPPAPIPLSELHTAGGPVDPDLPNQLIAAGSDINAHGFTGARSRSRDVAGLLSQAGVLLAWYSDRSTEGAPYWVNRIVSGRADAEPGLRTEPEPEGNAGYSPTIDRDALVAELRRQADPGEPTAPRGDVSWRQAFHNLANALDGTDWLAS